VAETNADEVGDEPVLIARRTGCPVVVARERVLAARALLAADSVAVILSDDGLQHYRLARRLEVAVVDGTRGLGNGLCLPAGPLREPPARLRRVDAIVVNGGEWGHAGVLRADLTPVAVYRLTSGEEVSLQAFRGRRVHAVAGIGHPERFFAMLADAGLEVVPHPLPDHARIAAADLTFGDGAPVLITEKDAVKCGSFGLDDVWCVAVDLEFRGEDEMRLIRLIERSLGLEVAR
jgi:tetraacyldisaccharide 4'-kinase